MGRIRRIIAGSVGSADLFMYYQYIREYHRDPLDIEDFFDGISAMSARVEIENPPT